MADNSPKTADFLLIPLGFMQKKTCVFNLEIKKSVTEIFGYACMRMFCLFYLLTTGRIGKILSR